MKSRDPGSLLPPEIRLELSSEEVRPVEDIWVQSSYVIVDIEDPLPAEPIEPLIPAYRVQMLGNLAASGVLPPAGRPATRILPRMRARILHLPSAWRSYAAIAACVIVLVAVGIALNSAKINAPYGEQVTQTLLDGSTLHINSGTRVHIGSGYNKDSRELRIERGEVFFEVKESPLPFIVRTLHGEISVLGTSFNVRHWPSDSESITDVAVASGTVLVTSRSGQEVTLAAGEAVRLGKRGRMDIAQSITDADNQLSWRRKGFKFSDHSTGDILEELERRYDINVEVKVEDLEKTRSGILLDSPEGPEQILSDLCELHQCAYIAGPDGRTFQLVPRR